MFRFKFIVFILILSLSMGIISHADPSYDLYDQLYYSCKIWGYYKYFHTEVAKGPDNINWDDALLEHLETILPGVSNEVYMTSLTEMINKAGDMEDPMGEPPDIPEELRYNLDLDWFYSDFISEDIRIELFEIKDKFRPQNNYYVGSAVSPQFDTDTAYSGSADLPALSHRMLALFRYWNAVNYFFPYKYIMDQDWDTTLVELIPYFLNSITADDYAMALLRLNARINDSHGFTLGTMIHQFYGYYFLPVTLKTIDEQTIITRVLHNLDIEPGDILLEINGTSIEELKEYHIPFLSASNISALNRDLNMDILRGELENDYLNQLKIQDRFDQIRTVYSPRNIFISDYYDYVYDYENEYDTWTIIERGDREIGYINMGLLVPQEVTQMFSDLWDTDGLIFDIRNYPHGTMWPIKNYLYDQDLHMANITRMDTFYPGTLHWSDHILHVSDTPLGVYNKKIIILFNEDTQSQAEFSVMGLEQHPKAIKIGSQTAGADGNISFLQLPGYIFAYFTGLGIYYPDNSPTQRIGIVPDIEMYPTREGIYEGKDELIDYALSLFDDMTTYHVHLYADPYNIGIELSGHGDYEEDDNVTISASFDGYWEFANWTSENPMDLDLLSDPDSANASFIMPSRNVRFKANFQQIIYGTPVYRFFNTHRGGHLYTMSEIERDHIIDNLTEWSYEGETFRVLDYQAENSIPAFRFFNTETGIHFYTINEHERDTVMDLPWFNYEGIMFYVYADHINDTVPIFRFFNHVHGGHLYTISEHERDTVMTLPDWTYEGIAFHVYPLR